MVGNKLKIVWTFQAKEAVRGIFYFYKKKSLQGAKNVVADILKSPKTIHYSHQYQIDDINPKYRRIIVRDYKVIYKEKGSFIQVIDVVCTLQHPKILASK